jgi:hypothetical protein
MNITGYKKPTLYSSVFILFIVLQYSCSTAYYGTMEKVGIHKRDILVDRVADARDAQANNSIAKSDSFIANLGK